MKWLIGACFLIIVGIGLKMALDTGEKSPIFASGSVELDPGLVQDSVGITTLFLVIFDQDSPMPMPYGAAKFTLDHPPQAGKFFDFVLTKEKLQIMGMGGGGQGFPHKMRLKARLDRDGFGGADQAGDIVGEISAVDFGGKDIHILLNRKI